MRIHGREVRDEIIILVDIGVVRVGLQLYRDLVGGDRVGRAVDDGCAGGKGVSSG